METLPVRAAVPSAYEQQALREIQLWKAPAQPSWLRAAAGKVDGAVHRASDALRRLPGVDWTIENVVAGLLRLTNELTQDSVWRDAIYRDYRTAGHAVERAEDVRRLDLAHVDDALDGLDRKYRAVAAAEGAATGYAGAPGILPDVVALVTINLRAAGEYATYCGFDLERPGERLFALQLLDAVSGPGDVTKEVALAPVIRLSRTLAKRQALSAVEHMALTRALQNAARALGVHLTRAKLAQAVPVVGAAVGGSFNAYYTSKVCDAAFYLYRERLLVEKYGIEALG